MRGSINTSTIRKRRRAFCSLRVLPVPAFVLFDIWSSIFGVSVCSVTDVSVARDTLFECCSCSCVSIVRVDRADVIISVSFNFDYILSSETNGYYKPHPSIYDLPEKIYGFSKKETLHVAGSAVDVIGSVSSGLPCYWSNRKNDILIDTKLSPEYEFEDLTELNNLLK